MAFNPGFRSEDVVKEFQSITGLSYDKSKQCLSMNGWQLELSLSNYFDHSDLYSNDLDPSLLSTCLPSQSQQQPLVQLPSSDDDFHCSLSSKKKDINIPLTSIKCLTSINDSLSSSTVTLSYKNQESVPLESTFTYRNEGTIVYHFDVLTSTGRRLKSVSMEKEEAEERYDDSLAEGKTGYLLEKSDPSQDALFTMSIGNLEPSESCTITLHIVQELLVSVESDLTSPVLSPTSNQFQTQSTLFLPWTKFVGTQDSIELDVSFKMSSSIHSIECPLAQTTIQGQSGTARLVLSGDHPSTEFVLNITTATEAQRLPAKIMIEPEAKVPDSKESEPKAVARFSLMLSPQMILGDSDGEETLPGSKEFIFLVDRSGSMAGSRMKQVKDALQLFLRSLPEGARFNIIGFGDNHTPLFPHPRPYDNNSFKLLPVMLLN